MPFIHAKFAKLNMRFIVVNESFLFFIRISFKYLKGATIAFLSRMGFI
jgi:hypothetical protein